MTIDSSGMDCFIYGSLGSPSRRIGYFIILIAKKYPFTFTRVRSVFNFNKMIGFLWLVHNIYGYQFLCGTAHNEDTDE